MANQDGEWLAPPGPYQELVKDLCQSDPRLRKSTLNIPPLSLPWANRPARIIVVEYHDNGNVEPTRLDLQSNEQLIDYLGAQHQSPEDKANRVLIVEGLNQKIAGALGSHFSIPPSMFAQFLQLQYNPKSLPTSEGLLASDIATRPYKTLKYHQLISLPNNIVGNFSLRCVETGRAISVTRIDGTWDSCGMLKRMCLYWSGKRSTGTGWDGRC
jgi:hypothetical protein